MNRLFGILAALAVLAWSGSAAAQITDINAAINKAGRERMLSQRMAKAYFQLGMQIDAERSRKILESSVSLFDRQLVELKNYSPNAEIKEIYLKLEKAWLAYKDVLLGSAPSPAQAKRVLELSEEVLGLAHQGTVQLEKLSGSSASRLVNVAGRQRMLSQRLAKYYQATAWGVSDVAAAVEIEKSRRDFTAAHQELLAAPANTPPIKDGLALVNQQWLFFEAAIGQKAGADKRLSANVASTSERILEEMEGVVALYEKASSK